MALFMSMEGANLSVINDAYEEVALLSVACAPAVWEVEVKGKWRSLNMELSTWLEDQWRGELTTANLNGRIEVRRMCGVERT